MKIIITREPHYKEQEYCILQFKGKFETEDLPTKSLVHLGSLYKVDEKSYKLEIGVMDLVGKAITLEQGWLYTQTEDGQDFDSKVIRVKGIVTTKILFDKRPCPNMERTETEPKIAHSNNLFKNMQK